MIHLLTWINPRYLAFGLGFLLGAGAALLIMSLVPLAATHLQAARRRRLLLPRLRAVK